MVEAPFWDATAPRPVLLRTQSTAILLLPAKLLYFLFCD